MQIEASKNYVINPSFKTCARGYKPNLKKYSGIFCNENIKTTTCLFRQDLDWDKFIKFAALHFYDSQKINVYSLAASDGSEAYSFAMSVLSKFLPQFAKKFLPVFASDIDPVMIKTAKSGRINILNKDLQNLSREDINTARFFTNKQDKIKIANNEDMFCGNSFSLKNELKNSVDFKQSDILTELENLEDKGNSIIMCRNVFPYLNDNYIQKIIDTANSKLKSGSLFLIGSFDNNINIKHRFLSRDFFSPLSEMKDYLFQKK